MITAALYGLGTALPLVIGAAVGLRWQLPRPLLAALMAFGAGTMIAAASEELFGPAFESAGAWGAGPALLAGAAVYVVASHLLDTRLGPSAVGFGLLVGATLDGIPENAALGVSLEAGGALVLLVAIIVGNTPEAVASAAVLRDDPRIGARRGLALWTAVGVLLILVTVGAHQAADALGGGSIALVQAFAGGATVAVLADTLMPEAYRDGGWWVGLATAVGFLLAYVIG